MRTEKLMKLITAFDAKSSANEFLGVIRRRVEAIVQNREPLILIVFTCSTIEARYLFSDTPWMYVSLDPTGNNLIDDRKRIMDVMCALREVYPPTILRILIGNTDPYYIYTQQFSSCKNIPREELWARFSERWAAYRVRLAQWVRDQLPGVPAEVISWYAFEKDIEERTGIRFEKEFKSYLLRAATYSNHLDMARERAQLERQFAPGKYFDGLAQPDEAVLRDWVSRKFAEYAAQAAWIRIYMPNALLIQNEKPSELRTAMYQPLVRERFGEAFPILYFLGIDNQGYQ